MPPAMPPPWASAWGDDEFGLWAELGLGSAVQRLRWIAPGEFFMGSPEDEPGRYGDESPQHAVRISTGFWLADTPCTQGVWKQVMGVNPSHHQGEESLPVEQVSWDDVQEFLQLLQTQISDEAAPSLPTEAQWEYACRAGTVTAFNVGETLDLPRANFDEAREGTVAVKSYLPNDWGLFDCHGQVWEWCADPLRDYEQTALRDAALVDPVGTGPSPGAHRAVRGGSWWYPALYCRSAYRNFHEPGDRVHGLGFRLSLRSTSPAPEGPGTGP
jgi:formylglycine-generating enzyme